MLGAWQPQQAFTFWSQPRVSEVQSEYHVELVDGPWIRDPDCLRWWLWAHGFPRWDIRAWNYPFQREDDEAVIGWNGEEWVIASPADPGAVEEGAGPEVIADVQRALRIRRAVQPLVEVLNRDAAGDEERGSRASLQCFRAWDDYWRGTQKNHSVTETDQIDYSWGGSGTMMRGLLCACGACECVMHDISESLFPHPMNRCSMSFSS